MLMPLLIRSGGSVSLAIARQSALAQPIPAPWKSRRTSSCGTVLANAYRNVQTDVSA